MMHRILVFTLSIFTCILTSAQTANWNWASQVIGNNWSITQDLESDDGNNVYSCGFFMDSASFGNHHLFYNNQTSFVAKYNTHGEVCWVNAFPCDHGSFADWISIDNEQNVLVLGQFSGTLQAGNYTLFIDSYATNFFLIKMDSSGTILWARQSISDMTIQPADMAVDEDNNIYVAGDNGDLTSFGNLATTKIGMFILKYTPGGDPVMLINEYGCNSSSVNVSSDQQICFSGAIIDTTVIGSETLYPTGYYAVIPTPTGFDSVFVFDRDPVFISYDLSGELSWVRQAKSKSYDNQTYVAMDESSNWYVMGNTLDTTDFWGNIHYPHGTDTPYLFKMDALGNIDWFRSGEPVVTFGGIFFRNLDYRDGKIYAIGSPWGTSSFAGLVIRKTSPEETTVILKIDTAGNGIWAVIDSTNLARNVAHAISTGPDNDIAICGFFEDSVHFGQYHLSSYGGWPTLYVARMASSLVGNEEHDPVAGQDELNIYPNPSSGLFTVETDEPINRILIMNPAGVIIREIQAPLSRKHQIRIDHPGLYLVSVFSENQIHSRKIIVTPGAK